MPLRVYPTLHDMRPTVASAERQVETFGLVRSLIQRDYPFENQGRGPPVLYQAHWPSQESELLRVEHKGIQFVSGTDRPTGGDAGSPRGGTCCFRSGESSGSLAGFSVLMKRFDRTQYPVKHDHALKRVVINNSWAQPLKVVCFAQFWCRNRSGTHTDHPVNHCPRCLPVRDAFRLATGRFPRVT